MEHTLTSLVWERANESCEYCLTPQRLSSLPFEIDHVIAEKHGGKTEASNLALSCFACNRYKGPNIAGVDPISGRIVRLFHPRNDRWSRHFRWESAQIAGRTAPGRATVLVLGLNHPDLVTLRVAWSDEGVFVLGRGFSVEQDR